MSQFLNYEKWKRVQILIKMSLLDLRCQPNSQEFIGNPADLQTRFLRSELIKNIYAFSSFPLSFK